MRTEFQTRDPHAAWRFLKDAFGAEVRLTSDPDLVRVVRGDLGPVHVDELDYAVGLTYETGGSAWLSVAEASEGWAEVVHPATTQRLVRGTVVALPPGQEVRGRSGPRIRQRVVSVRSDHVARAVRDLGDGESDGAVVFDQLSVRNRAATLRWQSLSDFVARTAAASPPGLDSELAAAGLAQVVAHTALSLFGNDVGSAASGTEEARDSHDGNTHAVRLAIAFIESSAHTDISLSDVAAASYVTPRALQYGFRRRLGTTPMAYLRQVRLHHARAELVEATSSTTVASVASRWGFFHLGRFAAYYREEFGEYPAQTLEAGIGGQKR